MAAPTFSSFPTFPEPAAASSSSRHGPEHDKEKRKLKHRQHRSRSREGSSRHVEQAQRPRRERDRDQRPRSRSREREEERHRKFNDGVYDDERDKARQDREDRRKRQRQEAYELATPGQKVRTKAATVIQQDEGTLPSWYDPDVAPKVFADVVPDRMRSTAEHSIDPSTYRRRLASVIGLPGVYRVEQGRDRSHRGIELGYRDHQSNTGRVRLPLQPPPTKIRRLAIPEAVPNEFDASTPFVRFSGRSGSLSRRDVEVSDEEFEEEFADLPPSDAERRAQVMTLEQRVRDNPTDVEGWLRYAAQHIPYGQYGDPLDAPLDKGSAEVALSVLNKALAANPGSSVLHLTTIRVMQQISNPDEIGARWAAALREFPLVYGPDFGEAFSVRSSYLGWCETEGYGTLGNDPVERVLELYRGSIRVLRLIVLDLPRQSDERWQYESAVLYLYHRLALFLKHAGYRERSLAMFQALVEITFFKPPTFVAPNAGLGLWWESLLHQFEQFWESETPRFGEQGSQGWKNGEHAVSSPGSAGPADPPADFTQWYDRETAHSSHETLRPMLEADDDPHGVVLFDDVGSLLGPILHPEVRLQAVFALLNFLGVTFTPPDTPTNKPQIRDPFMHWAVDGEALLPSRTAERQYPWREPEATGKTAAVMPTAVRSWAFDVDTLFVPPTEWFSYLDAHRSTADISLIRRCMAQLQPLIPDPRFGMIMLSFEASTSIKSAASQAKLMLSSDRSNLNLWNAYASLEIGRHRFDSARAVFANALSFSQAERGAAALTEDELDLLAGWVQMEADLGEKARAVDLLVTSIGGEAVDYMSRVEPTRIPARPTTTQLLRARQHFASKPHPTSDAQLRLLFSHRRLVLDDLPQATAVLCEAARPAGEDGEITYQFLVRQLKMDGSKTAQRELDRTLQEALDLYPHNTLFQSLRLSSTVLQSARAAQRLIEDIVASKEASVIQMLWSVGAMAQVAGTALWKADGSGAVRLRGLLSRLVQTSKGRQSSAIWQAYISFEARMGSTGVKQLCYRAVTNLASNKALYLLPFSPELRSYFSKQEHREWLLLMVERGIRIKTTFEHLLEPDAEVDVELFQDQLPSDEEPQEDELAFLHQREELKPYA